jgi:hypothetical protein
VEVSIARRKAYWTSKSRVNHVKQAMAKEIWNLPSYDCLNYFYSLHSYSSKKIIESLATIKIALKSQVNIEE